MTTFSAITSGQIDAESFIDTGLAGQWSNNVLAITEGDASASAYPILIAALDDPIKPWIEIGQLVAAGETTLEFEALEVATYDRFMVKVDSLEPGTDGALLYMVVGTGATPTYQTTNYYYGNYYGSSADVADTYTRSNGQNAARIAITSSGIGSAAPESLDGTIEFTNPDSATLATLFTYNAVYADPASTVLSFTRGDGLWRTVTAVTAIQFFMSSGTLGTGGTFTLYGLRK